MVKVPARRHSRGSAFTGLLAAIAAALLAVLVVIAVNTAGFLSKQLAVAPAPQIELDNRVAQRLGQALTYKTISYQNVADFDPFPFEQLRSQLESSFPLVHQVLVRDVVAEYSLLYYWEGTDRSLQPLLLMSHMDVVPVEPGTEDDWVQPPFSGAIDDGFVWGRGSLDDKVGVLAILEAVEHHLGQGFVPTRSVYLAFGHDEEIGGNQGAAAIVNLLKDRGVRLRLVLDEGGFVSTGQIEGIEQPVAVVGIAEKGYLTLKLTARGPGGHSSIPKGTTPIGMVAEAVRRLEKNPFPSDIRGATLQNLEYLGPEMPLLKRAAIANLWLLEPLVRREMLSTPTRAAQIRTTTAATIIHGGVKANVIPQEAYAAVNFRILPGETIESVTEYVRAVVDDSRIEIEPFSETENPSPVSDISGPAFAMLHRTIAEIIPDAIVAPYLVFGGTDAKHYMSLSDAVFRFTPMRLTEEDFGRFHGTNERISLENYKEIIRFYVRLIENSGLDEAGRQ